MCAGPEMVTVIHCFMQLTPVVQLATFAKEDLTKAICSTNPTCTELWVAVW